MRNKNKLDKPTRENAEERLLILPASLQLSLSEYQMNQTVNWAVWKCGDGFITSILCLKIRRPFPVPVSILTKSSVLDESGHKAGGREDEWKRKKCTSLPLKIKEQVFAHKSDACTYSCLHWQL
jgi:hypothetical protein